MESIPRCKEGKPYFSISLSAIKAQILVLVPLPLGAKPIIGQFYFSQSLAALDHFGLNVTDR
jgi:hypothetical protein